MRRRSRACSSTSSSRRTRRRRKQIILDLDATDDPLHGHQEGRFFHGYYDCYCYLPLYVFCGRHLLAAKLRRSNIDASAGAVEEVERGSSPRSAPAGRGSKILLRADSGFARDELMAWCEANGVDYVFGLARNERLVGAIAEELAAAEAESLAQGGPARRFADFAWRTLDSWSRARRVVAKAEHLPKGPNPRFVVTSLGAAEIDARTLYEDVYCARGEVENRIKEQQLDLFADRTSAATMRANQLRLWFASFAYVLLEALRRIGLRHTQFATATCGTIRLKLLKIGAQVRTQRAPDQGRHGLGLPLPDRVPPRLSLPAARRRLLNRPAYRTAPPARLRSHARNPPQPSIANRNRRAGHLKPSSTAKPASCAYPL